MYLFLSFWFVAFTDAQENADCLTCHDGKTLPSSSVHANLDCIACHTDLKSAEFPHEPPEKVNCGTCHDEEEKEFSGSLHGKALARGDDLAPRCQTCHGTHEILPVKDPKSSISPLRIPFVCGACHTEGSPVQKQREIHQHNILENYSDSMHGEALLNKGLNVTATCTSCHTAHHVLPHTDLRSSIARDNIANTCMKCHSQIETVHRKVIQGELWQTRPHVIPACVECHQPHKVRKVFYDQGMADMDCLYCHAKVEISASTDGRSLHVEEPELKGSVHGKTACAKCHTGVSPSKLRPCETVVQKVDCSVCHSDQIEQYKTSVHGKLYEQNNPNAPTYLECHGTHKILGKQNSQSPTFPLNVPTLCARCHREGEKAAVLYTGKEHDIIKRYTESIHGKGLLKSGLVVTAMCTDCHTAHHELPSQNPDSSVHRDNVAKTCARCHHGIYEQFVDSIHSPSVTRTDKELPVCNDCHSTHTIQRTDLEGFKRTIMSQCGRCHPEIAKTYFDTYHGKVSQLGYVKTAKCYDCHGAHDILNVDDPRSHLSRKNVVGTCRKCHPGATRRFAGYLTHATHHDPKKYPLLFWSFWGMTALLIGTFTIGGLHTLLWLPRAIQLRRKQVKEVPASPDAKQFQRFSAFNRTLHVVMIVSFMSLAVTGMTLKFSYTRWASVLSHLLGGFESAGFVHRSAAILMFSIFVLHIIDLFRLKRTSFGSWKAMFFGENTMLLAGKDLREFVSSIKWFLGFGERPLYGRWTYWEKFDYFAVFWGIAIIGSTGIFLWFTEVFTRLIPGWLINVATIIHSDEALLAVGFIFTIHFFNTHLRPEKFPMDIVIFTGRIPLEEFKRDKPAEYEALVKKGELEKHLTEPLPPIVVKTIRIFAWIALGVGFMMVVWIVSAMLFAYR